MYSEGDQTNAVYFVLKGEFELSRKLPRKFSNNRKALNQTDPRVARSPLNTLALRMPEMEDFPTTYRLNILEIGSIAGEEDCF